VAVTVIFWGVGMRVGAVNSPVTLTVPTEALPPEIPFTAQATFWFVVPLTVAFSCKVCVTATNPDDGLTVIETDCGSGGLGGVLPFPPPHPAVAMHNRKQSDKIIETPDLFFIS
jgi:hypothetical protein